MAIPDLTMLLYVLVFSLTNEIKGDCQGGKAHVRWGEGLRVMVLAGATVNEVGAFLGASCVIALGWALNEFPDFENFKVARMYYHLADRLTTKELVNESYSCVDDSVNENGLPPVMAKKPRTQKSQFNMANNLTVSAYIKLVEPTIKWNG
ncbi:hypothetical protein Tco_0281753 [Tanacetum coccineum]